MKKLFKKRYLREKFYLDLARIEKELKYFPKVFLFGYISLNNTQTREELLSDKRAIEKAIQKLNNL